MNIKNTFTNSILSIFFFVCQLSLAQNSITISGSCALTINLNKWGFTQSINSQTNSGMLLILNFDTKQATGFNILEALSSTNLNNNPVFTISSTSTLSPPYLSVNQTPSDVQGIISVSLAAPVGTSGPLNLLFAPTNSNNTFLVSTAMTNIYGTGVCQKM
jgi:hypothetical protein